MGNYRLSKDEYYLNIAKQVSKRSTCLRKKYGAVIVKNDKIVSTGYNGSPKGTANCSDIGECKRVQLNIPSGSNYELCRSVHAEANALLQSSREEHESSTLYLVGVDPSTDEVLKNVEPCMMCKRLIINSSISRVITPDGTLNPSDWIDIL